MISLRKVSAGLAMLALLGGLWSAGSTVHLLVSTEPGTGTILSRTKAGFRTWKITVTYPSSGAAEPSGTFIARGYYRGPAYAPGTEIPIRLGANTGRLGSFQDLWLRALFFGLLGGLFVGLVSMTGTRAAGAGSRVSLPEKGGEG